MKNGNQISLVFIVIIFFIVMSIISIISSLIPIINNNDNNNSNIKTDYSKNIDTLKIISSSENKDLESIIKNYAEKEGIDIQIDYAGTLDIMEMLNSGDEEYDAVWVSNSIWLYMLNDSVKVSESKSTSINPVVFAIKDSVAEKLGLKNKEIYTKDIVEKIQNGDLKFSMSNPTQTNTGATAYLGLLSTIAGNPEVLREENLEDNNLKENLVSLFSGLERSSGSEDFLEEMFLNGDYEAVVTYEASIINMNQKLEKEGKETLYALYPVDGVSISDSPFAYINNGDSDKKEEFLKIRDYILSEDGQKELAKTGRRTWYGGVNSNVDKTVFNPKWGIDTTTYIVPLKFPSTSIIQEALALYQNELRKPIHAVFCLDYSASMNGDGYKQLNKAMNYILDEEEASKDLLQFTEKDKITVIPFSSHVINVWETDSGTDTELLISNINEQRPSGSTNIYEASRSALKTLKDDDSNKYNLTVILMTDGKSNMGEFSELEKYYEKKSFAKNIPIYSIMFGDADEDELQNIADLTNAKVFDGKSDLLKAFKEVRGYN